MTYNASIHEAEPSYEKHSPSFPPPITSTHWSADRRPRRISAPLSWNFFPRRRRTFRRPARGCATSQRGGSVDTACRGVGARCPSEGRSAPPPSTPSTCRQSRLAQKTREENARFINGQEKEFSKR